MRDNKSIMNLAYISHFRSELMGLAMILIFLFHINCPCYYPLIGFVKSGNVGVEIFLFLSGVGLWYSWMKNPNIKNFYKRRFLRIVPTWLFFSSLYYFSHFFYHRIKGDVSESWIHLIGQVTINYDFWKIGDCTFWFIPALMVLYLFAPIYMKLIQKYSICKWLPLFFIIWGFFVDVFNFFSSNFGDLDIFWNRIPIFLIGINVGSWIKSGYQLSFKEVLLVIISFIISIAISWKLKYVSYYAISYFFHYLVYIPLSLSMIVLLCMAFIKLPRFLIMPLSFIGSLSLEYYLIHQNFILIHFPKDWNFGVTFILCFLITSPLAWLYSLLRKRLIS